MVRKKLETPAGSNEVGLEGWDVPFFLPLLRGK